MRGNLRISCIFRPLTRICSSLRSHNCGLSPSLCYGSRLTQLVPRWFALLLKGRGWFAVKFVMLNLFQHLATVTELQVGFTNPTITHRSFKPMKTRNIMVKAPHPSPPPQRGREFQAYHYGDYAITTQTASARNDKITYPERSECNGFNDF